MERENAVEDETVKSALEIAMERISGLPELTAEEIAEQKEKEFRPLGEALANKYMQEVLDEKDLLSGFNEQKGTSRSIIRRASVALLCRSIQLEDFRATVRAMNGLCRLAGNAEGIRNKANAIWSRILDDFGKRKDITLQKIAVSEKEKLESFGISGTAVRPNLKDNESLEEELDELYASFEPDLKQLRAVFLQQLQPE